MIDSERPVPYIPDFHYPVTQRADPGRKIGSIVGLIFKTPPLALVRWRGDGSAFEPLDEIVQATQKPS